ncbi:hypothetical protein [Streptomyces sp. NPDC005336]
MPDMTGLTQVLAANSHNDGPGALLRTIIIVGVVGAVLLAWFLLRGYK